MSFDDKVSSQIMVFLFSGAASRKERRKSGQKRRSYDDLKSSIKKKCFDAGHDNSDSLTNGNNDDVNGNICKFSNEAERKNHIESKLEAAFGNFIASSERLNDLLEKCSELASQLRDDDECRDHLKMECENFSVEYREVPVPSAGNWRSSIKCLKSILDLKAPIFFAGESDELFEQKCPAVEQFQLLEKIVPMLEPLEASESMDSVSKLIRQDLKTLNDEELKSSALQLAQELDKIGSAI